MTRQAVRTALTLLFGFGIAACTDTRGKALERQVEQIKPPEEKREVAAAEVPPHPMRDALMPVLQKIYPLQTVPPVVETETSAGDEYNYEVQAGVAAVVKLSPGLTDEQKIKAIVTGTAEADAWSFRTDARRDYADLIHRVKRKYANKSRYKQPSTEAAEVATLAACKLRLDSSAKSIFEGVGGGDRRRKVRQQCRDWGVWVGL